ncbi:hypothetical protein NERG_02351 [Nematocida ausubeli]|uniref:Uncharacterized protein n=1 Tax=Nematocida ausubeli (strain ATCC PRA-371 / ERTm2) TaxID=1913371 RepID=H8ZFI0_NEMA1|nr:hypothetical protein NERG_02351 [Nematocida ausubeli]
MENVNTRLNNNTAHNTSTHDAQSYASSQRYLKDKAIYIKWYKRFSRVMCTFHVYLTIGFTFLFGIAFSSELFYHKNGLYPEFLGLFSIGMVFIAAYSLFIDITRYPLNVYADYKDELTEYLIIEVCKFAIPMILSLAVGLSFGALCTSGLVLYNTKIICSYFLIFLVLINTALEIIEALYTLAYLKNVRIVEQPYKKNVNMAICAGEYAIIATILLFFVFCVYSGFLSSYTSSFLKKMETMSKI